MDPRTPKKKILSIQLPIISERGSTTKDDKASRNKKRQENIQVYNQSLQSIEDGSKLLRVFLTQANTTLRVSHVLQKNYKYLLSENAKKIKELEELRALSLRQTKFNKERIELLRTPVILLPSLLSSGPSIQPGENKLPEDTKDTSNIDPLQELEEAESKLRTERIDLKNKIDEAKIWKTELVQHEYEHSQEILHTNKKKQEWQSSLNIMETQQKSIKEELAKLEQKMKNVMPVTVASAIPMTAPSKQIFLSNGEMPSQTFFATSPPLTPHSTKNPLPKLTPLKKSFSDTSYSETFYSRNRPSEKELKWTETTQKKVWEILQKTGTEELLTQVLEPLYFILSDKKSEYKRNKVALPPKQLPVMATLIPSIASVISVYNRMPKIDKEGTDYEKVRQLLEEAIMVSLLEEFPTEVTNYNEQTLREQKKGILFSGESPRTPHTPVSP